MKKSIIIFGIACLTFLSSCGGKLKTDIVSSTSADGTLILNVKGTRKHSMDAFNAHVSYIRVQESGNDTVNALSKQIHATDLTSENVQFDWINSEQCAIIFTHQDGVQERIPVHIQKKPANWKGN